jgi:hypothetical protein
MVNGASMKMHEVNLLNEVRDRVQGGIDLGEAIEVIDSNMTITGTFKVTIDTFTFVQGWQVSYRPTTLEWLARSDNSARFRTRGFLEGFQVMNQQSFSTMKLCQVELMILNQSLKGNTTTKKVICSSLKLSSVVVFEPLQMTCC